MTKDERYSALLTALDDVERRGMKTVEIANLRRVIDNLWGEAPANNSSHDAAYVGAQYSAQLEGVKFAHAERLEVLKQVFPFALEAIKCVVLANAGGAGALLAFVGSLIGKGEKVFAGLFATSTLFFMLGVAAGIFCWDLSYLSQTLFVQLENKRVWGITVQVLAIGAFLCALGMFLAGGISAYRVFAALPSS